MTKLESTLSKFKIKNKKLVKPNQRKNEIDFIMGPSWAYGKKLMKMP